MTPNTRRRCVAVTILISAVGLSGCSAVKAVNKVRHDVDNNKATISSFTTQLKSSAATPFEATYMTTGSNPATVVYAVDPPNGVSFTDTPTSQNTPSIDIIANSQGEYSCTKLNCQKLPPVDAATENKIFDFYTPSHWITFLRDFSLAAGFAGDQVTSSTKSINGFSNMSCVDFHASGVAGTSTICTTSQGILGYVKVAQDSTKFEIKSYTGSPSPSLFQLPAGAKVTVITPPSASPSS